MIVGSLLLILVAVTLLVMGLATGSSVLWISSIAASLLAAIALVIGARQAAAARVAAGGPARSPLAVDLDDDPGPATGPLDGAAYGDGAPGRRSAANHGEFFGDVGPDDGWPSEAAADPESDRPTDSTETEMLSDGQLDSGVPGNPAETTQADLRYDGPDSVRDDVDPADYSQPGRQDPYSGDADSSADRLDPAYPDLPDPAQAGRDDVLAQLAADDTDEDPADEPLPQRVQPGDAVQVSRMSADVLVVDGRPRYHVADCPHLYERDSEPLPVAEAVDLGFTPCGMCMPVDRLLAGAARR